MKQNKKIISMCNDLITIFTRYANILYVYFKNVNNRDNHSFLYKEYLFLQEDLKKVEAKYKK